MIGETRTGTTRSTLTDLAQRLTLPGWYLLAFLAGGILLGSLPGYLVRVRVGTMTHQIAASAELAFVLNVIGVLASLVAAGISLWLGIVLFRRRGDKPMALFLSAFLIFYGVVMGGPLEALAALVGLEEMALASQGLVAPLLVLLLLLFPTGTFVPSRTRLLAPIALFLGPSTFFLTKGFPGTMESFWGTILGAAIVVMLAIGIYAQVFRYRRVSSPEERQRTKWAVYGLCLWIVLVSILTVPFVQVANAPPDTLFPWWWSLTSAAWWLSLTIVPISFTIAILRHQLLDINLLINRTLVYIGLTAGVVGLYVLLVGSASALFQTRGNLLVSLLATGLIAVIFQPLRERLQRAANRLLYGDRDDPYAVLSELSRQLGTTVAPETMLPAIVETIARTLKLPYTGITLEGDSTPISYGLPTGEILALPLLYQDARVGALHLARRSPDEPFTTGERRLLEDIARQTGVAAHAVRLTADLQRSRERLVTAREEERRRLRRDLHDGLGPSLASLVLQAESARDLVASNPDQARKLLTDVIDQAETAVEDIRRLVYNLRPPALDELGLLGALRQLIDNLSGEHTTISLDAPPELPPLSAAVEVAAYRIAQEALTNVVRHARATACRVQLKLHRNDLLLDITDNGLGLSPDHAAGVGLVSMRERAGELGGDLAITSKAGGTSVAARLPFHNGREEGPS